MSEMNTSPFMPSLNEAATNFEAKTTHGIKKRADYKVARPEGRQPGDKVIMPPPKRAWVKDMSASTGMRT